MSKVNFKIDGLMVLTAVGVVGAIYLYNKKEKIIAAVDPTNSENIVNQAVIGVVGQENVTNVADKVFAAIDLINPFNDSDAFARKVYGLDDATVKPAVEADRHILAP